MEPSKKMRKARAGLVMDQPFFGSLALRLDMRESDQVPIAATDGTALLYNPAAVEKLSLQECKFLIAHEVMHVAMQHHLRQGSLEPEKFNHAADYAINGILIDSGVGKFIEGGLHEVQYDGLSSEAIYSRLPNPPKGKGGGGSGPLPTGTVEKAGTYGGKTDAQGKPLAPTFSPAELAKLSNECRIATAQAVQQAAAAGKLSGALERFAEATRQPRVDWRNELRRFLTMDTSDYSWTRPNRRHIWRGIYLPGLHAEGLPDIAIAVDTSSSISQSFLESFASELSGILQDFPECKMRVIYCAADVSHDETFSADNLPVKITARIGGGTAFQPVFDWIEENDVRPTCLVYLTDLYGDNPIPPDYPVLWVSWGDEAAPFGDIITIPEDAR